MTLSTGERNTAATLPLAETTHDCRGVEGHQRCRVLDRLQLGIDDTHVQLQREDLGGDEFELDEALSDRRDQGPELAPNLAARVSNRFLRPTASAARRRRAS